VNEEKQHVRGLKSGNRDSFTYLYNKYCDQVYHFSELYLTAQQDVEEVVQEVFIKLWEARDRINEDENLKGFLFIVTRNLIFNHSRKSINQEFYYATVLSALEDEYNVEEEIEARNLEEYIDQLILELPPRRREIFQLSRREHKTYKEIAVLLDISEKTVENQMSEALKYLRKNIVLLLLFLS